MAVNDISIVANLELGELSTLTDIQQNMYLTDAMYENIINKTPYIADKDDEVIPSRLYVKPKKTTLYAEIVEKMSMMPGGSSEYNFMLNEKMDFISYVYKYRKFPGIKIKDSLKDNIQISWCHNLGHHSIDSLELMIDNDPKQTITDVWLDNYVQHFVSNDHIERYRQNICDKKYSKLWTTGDINKDKSGKVWGTELKPLVVKVPLPFSFDKTPFPIFLATQSKVVIKGRFKMKLSQLIKIRVKKGDLWEEIPYDWRVLEGISGEDYMLPEAPELYACYSKITKEEKKYWLDTITDKKPYKYYYNDIMPITYDKLFTSTEPFSDVLSSKTPVKGIYWVAQNALGLPFNNYSNYTTDPYDSEIGEDPISKVSLKHAGNSYRVKEMDSSHFTDMMSYYRCSSSSYSKGYGCVIFSKNVNTIDGDIGPIFDITKSTLSLTLEDNKDNGKRINDVKQDELLKSILDRTDNKSKSNNKYKIHLFVQVVKQFKFSVADKIRVSDGN